MHPAQVQASLRAGPESGFVTVDIYSGGKPETLRLALETVRGFPAQKLIAHSVKVRLIERDGSERSLQRLMNISCVTKT